MTTALDELLLPHVDGTLPGRFVDTPPSVVRRALAVLPERYGETRPNAQPPASWLVSQAERRGGLLSGLYSIEPWWGLRVDAVCVPRSEAAGLVEETAEAWPPFDVWPAAIDLALAEGWDTWDAVSSSWEGPGRALLDELPDLPVFGLWWD